MRAAKFWLAGLIALTAALPGHAKPAAHPLDAPAPGASFPVGNLTFSIPAHWQAETPDGPARSGQWRVPPLKPGGEPGEIVAYFWGPGIGGSVEENITGWRGTMLTTGDKTGDKRTHYETDGHRISQVALFGTYNQVVHSPGVPPVARPNYGLLGAVVENAGGNIYWRFTGPEPLVIATVPLFDKMIASVKAPAPK